MISRRVERPGVGAAAQKRAAAHPPSSAASHARRSTGSTGSGGGVSSMTLSADPANPSCGFYAAIGADHQRDAGGRESPGAFIWNDLETLARVCPVDPPLPKNS